MSDAPLRGNQCECIACGERFTGVRPFDDHRVGKIGVLEGADRRRCLTGAELRMAGWRQEQRGWGRATRVLEAAQARGNRGVAA